MHIQAAPSAAVCRAGGRERDSIKSGFASPHGPALVSLSASSLRPFLPRCAAGRDEESHPDAAARTGFMSCEMKRRHLSSWSLWRGRGRLNRENPQS